MHPLSQPLNADQLRADVAAMEMRVALHRMLFPQQLAFVRDGTKRKAALCSRRAGKSFGVAAYMCIVALSNASSICVYIALTRLSAKRILWPALRKIDTAYSLGLTFNATELTVTFPNGSQIWLVGAEDQSQIEKLRGQAYHLAVIDEAASFGSHLEELVDEVLEPALLDFDGVLCLIGTPSAACVGKFYSITTAQRSGEWSCHRWTVLSNPHLPRAKEWLENRRAQNGWTEQHPIYRREWLGEWVWDASSMVYRCTSDNVCDPIEFYGADWIHVLGVDLGFDDDTALQVVSSHIRQPNCYVHHGWKSPGLTVTQVADKISEYMREWQISQVVLDTGGIGKMVAEELKKRHALPIKAAEKQDKLGAVELMNGDFFSKRLSVFKGEPVLKEMEVLQWDETRKKEDPRYPNHCCDATLYAYREAIHWAHRPAQVMPAFGTPAFVDMDEDMLEEENALNYNPNDDDEAYMF